MAKEMAISEAMAEDKLPDNAAESLSLLDARSAIQEEAECEGTREVKEAENFVAWADMLLEALAAIFSRLLFEELLNIVP